MKLKELLKKELTKKELSILPSSFDFVGDLLIFNDFPIELIKKEKRIGKKILNHFKNIKVVTKKVKKYSGVFRTPVLKIIAGERRKTTVHKENDVRLSVNPEKAYFSSRTSTERKRIFQLVKLNESVLVMFSGIAPFPVTISKNTKAKEVFAIEINPLAHEFAEENVKLNKLDNIKLFNGDVNDIFPKIKKKFDRIIMPLPKSAESFLELALTKIKKKGVIHLYSFLDIDDKKLVKEKKQLIKQVCKQNKKVCKSIKLVKCGQFSPQESRVCFDINLNS